MLHEFLTLHRDEIIARTRAKVAARTVPQPTDEELERGIPSSSSSSPTPCSASGGRSPARPAPR